MTQWILTSSVLILLVIAVRGLFRNKMKAKYVYALWLIVLVRLLCPVNFGELSFNLLSLAEAGKAQIAERIGEEETSAQQETAVYEEWEAQKEFYESHGIMYVDPENPNVIVRYPVDSDDLAESYLPMEDAATAESLVVVESKSAAEETVFSLPEINWQKVLPFAWIIGMAVVTIVILSVNISFSTTLGVLREELPILTKKGRGKKKLSVYLADGIYSSCLYGVVHPSIYLNNEGMGEQEKTYCVEHEYSHYLQGDMVWSLCRAICLILHWYNPLVWLAAMLSKKDAELACDERTIERLGEEERYSYGHTLVELAASQSKTVQMFGMATLMASDKKEVVERVKAIATKKETKIITGLLVTILVVGIGFFVFTGEGNGEQKTNQGTVPTATGTPAPTETPTPVPVAGEVYEDITFTDHISLTLNPDKGWNIDFDGDGSKERLYIDGFKVYLNGELQQVREGIVAEYWILDIDTTDSMYELLSGNGDLYIYDGNALIMVKGVQVRHFYNVCTYENGEFVPITESDTKIFTEDFFTDSDGEIYVRYFPKLGEFTRIDEHTICFENIFSMEASFKANAQYVLDENHGLQVVPMEYDITPLHEINGVQWYHWKEKQNDKFKVYKNRDLSGEYTERLALSDVKLLKSDCVEWAYIETPNGTKGWLYFGEEQEYYFYRR